MTAHLIQVFLFGAFKYPRELTWITGLPALVHPGHGVHRPGHALRPRCLLGSRHRCRDRRARAADRTAVVQVMLGGPIIAAETLSALLRVARVRDSRVAHCSGRGAPAASSSASASTSGRCRGRQSAGRRTGRNTKHCSSSRGVPFFPTAIDNATSCLRACSSSPSSRAPPSSDRKGRVARPNPTMIDTNPRPDFYFLSLFSVLALLPPSTETVLILTAPVVGIALLLPVPFISNTGEKSGRRRPVAVLGVLVVMLTISRPRLARHVLAVVAADGGVEWNRPRWSTYRDARRSAARRPGRTGQAMPQLPLARRSGRSARTGARRRRDAPDARPADSSGASGRRQHAGLRQ